ncbi:MAG: anthranilate phosphoribosyltransferase, partial [Thermoanaerobaculia bacterium]
MITQSIRRAMDGQHLEREEMHEVFGQVMDGAASDVLKSALLVALRMKGETADEITGAAMAMRERVTPLDYADDKRDDLVDT